MIIDTHAHIDFEAYDEDFDEMLDRAEKAGITHIIIPGADLNNIEKAHSIAMKYDEIFYAVGVHPTDLDSFDIDKMRKFIENDKCVAVGECGLDYFRLEGSEEFIKEEKELQERYFRTQIDLALEYKLPLVVHSRDSDDDTIRILQDYDFSNTHAIIHCLPSSESLAKFVENSGIFCSIGGVSTFKNAKDLRNIIENSVDINKILLETDSPFLTPHPHRGKRNEPHYVKLVLENIALLKKLPLKEAEELIFNNTNKAFKLNLV